MVTSLVGRSEPATSVTLDAAVCGFPVEISFDSNEFITTFSSGRQLITGRFTAQLTGNGKTITVNASGPAVVTAEGATLRGASILTANPGDLGPGHPGGLLLAHGPVTITPGENGQVQVEFTSARAVDLCPVLAE